MKLSINSLDCSNDSINSDTIKGVVKMENPTGKLIEFVLENNKSIKVTPNHLMIVKDILLNKIIELPAFKVKEEESRYLLPCIE